jgi:hypothetical protein
MELKKITVKNGNGLFEFMTEAGAVATFNWN